MQPGEIVAGRFEIDSLAGSGGMGAVYKARDRQTGLWVALKVLHGHGASHAERFAREAQLLSELRHPGIVRFVGSGATASGEGFIVMEWLEGESLSERLKRGPLSLQDVLVLGTRVADALRPAHERGIVHRDLKPQNLFLEHGSIEHVKVLDFGIARVLDKGQKLTVTGAMLGTPGYMSPEQTTGKKEVDSRTDVYALGCVLFRAVTGRPVFEADDPFSILVRVTMEEAPRSSGIRPDVPPALDDLLARMLAMDPAARPRDAAAVLAELAVIGGWQGGATAIAPSSGAPRMGPTPAPAAQAGRDPSASGPSGFAALPPSSFSPAPPPAAGAAAVTPSYQRTQPSPGAPGYGPPPPPAGVPWPGAAGPTPIAHMGMLPTAEVPPPTVAGPVRTFTGPGPAVPPPAAAGSGRATLFVLLGAIGALLLLVVIGGALAMFVFWPSSKGGGGPVAGGGPTGICPGERCVAATISNPSRADAVALLPEAKKLARDVDPTADLVLIQIVTASGDGTVDLTNQQQFLHYHFQPPVGNSRFLVWMQEGRMVVIRSTAVDNQKPLTDPGCPVTSVWRNSGAGGRGNSTLTLLNPGPPVGEAWFVSSPQATVTVDPRTCAIKRPF
jgi:serine/threonine-protein kinase